MKNCLLAAKEGAHRRVGTNWIEWLQYEGQGSWAPIAPGPEADEMTTAMQLRDALLAMDPLNKVPSPVCFPQGTIVSAYSGASLLELEERKKRIHGLCARRLLKVKKHTEEKLFKFSLLVRSCRASAAQVHLPYQCAALIQHWETAPTRGGAHPFLWLATVDLHHPLVDLVCALWIICVHLQSAILCAPYTFVHPQQGWVVEVNKAEAEYWKRSGGVRVGWSDEILGFDCGGQQWVLEVSGGGPAKLQHRRGFACESGCLHPVCAIQPGSALST
eukprot:1159344-Pelagomonas_calceolata.AAC.6